MPAIHQFCANFSQGELPELMTFLRARGVKGYLTLNTLVFENELAEAEQYLRTMIAAGVDAVILKGGLHAWRAAGGEIVADGGKDPRIT